MAESVGSKGLNPRACQLMDGDGCLSPESLGLAIRGVGFLTVMSSAAGCCEHNGAYSSSICLSLRIFSHYPFLYLSRALLPSFFLFSFFLLTLLPFGCSVFTSSMQLSCPASLSHLLLVPPWCEMADFVSFLGDATVQSQQQ